MISSCKQIADSSLISDATKRNWSRLSYSIETKLSSRANKKLSQKTIIPVEYFTNLANVAAVQEIVEYVKIQDYLMENVIYSFAINLLSKKSILNHPCVQKTLSDYSYQIHKDLLDIALPSDENDILGIIYQCLLTEGEKNIVGAYYTSNEITAKMTADLDFTKEQTFFDPCCGSGAFLLALKNVKPNQIFGVDNNPIAVMIAKINLLLKYDSVDFIPQIRCCDYLDDSLTSDSNEFLSNKYDYIITNPPWGAAKPKSYPLSCEITSRESFSLFFVKAYKQLAEGGIIRFLFPESILKVKTHKDIRKFLLNNGNLYQISYYTNTFAGVTTKIIDIMHQKASQTPNVTINNNGCISKMPISAFLHTENNVFNILCAEDIAIIKQVKGIGAYNLSGSIWALGIVTGDNKKKLKQKPETGYEAIYTGKEIMPYRLKQAKNYLIYNRKQLQQVAKDEYYRTKEKLVYKFIANKLVFAYDNSGALFLNSANILIPNIPNMSIKTVLAFLNSELYQYLYCALFSEIKVLKGNLSQLPFPKISNEKDEMIASYVQEILNGNDNYVEKVQNEVYQIFNLSDKQKHYIRSYLSGTINN